MLLNLYGVLLLGTPIVFAILSGVFRRRLTHPQDYTEKQIKWYKLASTLCGVAAGVFAGILVGLIALIYMAAAFM